MRRNFADNFAAATPSQIYLTHTQDDSSTKVQDDVELTPTTAVHKSLRAHPRNEPSGVQKGENISPSRRLRRIGLKDTVTSLKVRSHIQSFPTYSY